jgi:hypothetical protein
LFCTHTLVAFSSFAGSSLCFQGGTPSGLKGSGIVVCGIPNLTVPSSFLSLLTHLVVFPRPLSLLVQQTLVLECTGAITTTEIPSLLPPSFQPPPPPLPRKYLRLPHFFRKFTGLSFVHERIARADSSVCGLRLVLSFLLRKPWSRGKLAIFQRLADDPRSAFLYCASQPTTLPF